MTVLDYVVQTMLSNANKKKFTTFPNELQTLKDATKCSPSVLAQSLKNIEKGIKHMEKEAKLDQQHNGDDPAFSNGIIKFLTKFGTPKYNQFVIDVQNCSEKCSKLREHFGEEEQCDVVKLFDVLDKFSCAFAMSVKKTTEKEARKKRMKEQSRGRAQRRASRSPDSRKGGSSKEGKEGKEGHETSASPQKGRRRSRKSRSPGRDGRRSRGSSVEGKSGGGGGGGGGGTNLLAAIMAKGGIGGLKKGIQMKKSASPETKARHDMAERLMTELLTMGHEREEVQEISEQMMKNKSLDAIERMLESGKTINARLDEIHVPRVMSASEKRVAMLNAMMAGRK